MVKKPRRIQGEKVFVRKELSKRVTALTTAKVNPQRDYSILQPVSRGIGQVLNRTKQSTIAKKNNTILA